MLPAIRRKHGDSNSRLYRCWANMRDRCYNPACKSYAAYGGRGIKIDPTWDAYIVFRVWAILNGYAEDLTIDRIDSKQNYCPSNCRWITKSENSARIIHYTREDVQEAFDAGYQEGYAKGFNELNQ